MDKDELGQFFSKFAFQQKMVDFVGIERERFLTNSHNLLVPRSADFLSTVKDSRWTHELSACQVEDRTQPRKEINNIKKVLAGNNQSGHCAVKQLGLNLRTIEVASEDMPLTVYPEPRYLQIAKEISRERLSSACRVTGTHFHLGMPNLQIAIQTANAFRNDLNYFCDIGDHSEGERLRLYKAMAIDWRPPFYENAEHFFTTAQEKGFAQNPRDCWHFIRISIHGTVELRMFGSTEDLDEICWWVEEVKKRMP